jgi:hypothetical protein
MGFNRADKTVEIAIAYEEGMDEVKLQKYCKVRSRT